MAKFGSFKNGQIVLNSYDLSDHCSTFELNTTTEELDNHAMGDYTNFSTPGLLHWEVTASFFADFAAGSVHECLENLRAQLASLGVPPTFAMVLKANKAAATSSTNPAWSGQGFISKYKPVGAEHGKNYMIEVTIAPAGNLSILSA